VTDPAPDGRSVEQVIEEQGDLEARLAALSADARAAHAAAAAERLLPHFERFHERTGAGSPAILRSALTHVRTRLSGGREVTLRTMLDSFGQIQVVADHIGERTGRTLDEDTRIARLAWYAAAAVTNACHVCVHGRVHETRLCLEYEDYAARLAGDVTG